MKKRRGIDISEHYIEGEKRTELDLAAKIERHQQREIKRKAVKPDIERILGRAINVAGEMLERVENQVYDNEGGLSTTDIRAVNQLMGHLTKAADLHLKIQRDAERKGKKLTPEEKDEQIILFIKSKGPILRKKFLKKMWEALEDDE